MATNTWETNVEISDSPRQGDLGEAETRWHEGLVGLSRRDSASTGMVVDRHRSR